MGYYPESPTDPLTGLALAVAGMFALSMAVWHSPRHAHSPRHVLSPLLAFLAGAGLLALAADEALDLHERAGGWLWRHGIDAPGPLAHVDDLIVLLYAVAAVATASIALPALLQHRGLVLRLGACGGLLAVAVALDVLGEPGSRTEIPEEGLEVLGAIALAAVFAHEAMRAHAWRAVTITDPDEPNTAKAIT